MYGGMKQGYRSHTRKSTHHYPQHSQQTYFGARQGAYNSRQKTANEGVQRLKKHRRQADNSESCATISKLQFLMSVIGSNAPGLHERQNLCIQGIKADKGKDAGKNDDKGEKAGQSPKVKIDSDAQTSQRGSLAVNSNPQGTIRVGS